MVYVLFMRLVYSICVLNEINVSVNTRRPNKYTEKVKVETRMKCNVFLYACIQTGERALYKEIIL